MRRLWFVPPSQKNFWSRSGSDHWAVVSATKAELSSLVASGADWQSLRSSCKRARVRSRRAIAASSETYGDAEAEAAASGASSESRCAQRRRNTPFTCSANPRAAAASPSRCPLVWMTRATHTLRVQHITRRQPRVSSTIAHLTIHFNDRTALLTWQLTQWAYQLTRLEHYIMFIPIYSIFVLILSQHSYCMRRQETLQVIE